VPALLRLIELLACLMIVAWTVVFPLATLLSLLMTLPLLAALLWPPHRIASAVRA
jgi:hypothetical protein